ncbi:MAG: DNA repair protein RecO [Erysipelotrichaceae bacterium]|nr:DNA repair protein RecO [Erysipelotrichaceae bacterium]
MMKTTINEVEVEAIILKKSDYKENDQILYIYTKEYGKLSVLAKGIKKLTSKNARACQTLMISQLTIHLKKGMCLLMRATPINYLRHIQEDIERDMIAQYICEYFYRYIEDNVPDLLEYQYISKCLTYLDEGMNPLLTYLLFNVFILEHNGVSIYVDGCVMCQSSKVVAISLKHGGFVCHEHLESDKVLDKDVLKNFRHLCKVPIDKAFQLDICDEAIHTMIPIMDSFVEEYTGIHLKTSKFIKKIL